MKHRHRLAQAQRRKPSTRNRRPDVDEASDEQPRSGAGKAKKSSMHHMKAEGGRTKLRLDKFRRGGRRTKRFDNGGTAGSALDPPAVPTIRAERFLQRTKDVSPLRIGYATRLWAAPSRPTSAVGDRREVTTPAA